MKTILIFLYSLIVFLVFGIGFMVVGKGIEVKEKATDYQMNVDNTGADIFDGNRYVGRLKYGRNIQLDSLIDYDNQ